MHQEEKVTTTVEHREDVQASIESWHDSQEPKIVGLVAEVDELPRGYFRSKYFLDSTFATSMGLMAGVGQFGYAAPILDVINADLGPDPNYIWISLIYNVCLSVFLPIVGRLSDILGRRYFFVGGVVLGVIGTIICATAQSMNVLIGASVICGIANATQLSFHVVIGELIPLKYRYAINAVIYAFCIPGSGFGGVIAYSFVVHYPSMSWCGPYYLLIAINTIALVSWILFYFPPTFNMKHKDQGSSSGSVYPWKSGKVIGTLVGGFAVLVVFALYECYMPLKAPFMPMHLFKNTGWVYAFAVIFPMQSAVLYAEGDLIYLGGLSCLIGCGIISGQMSGGFLGEKIGKVKYQCMVMFLVGGAFLGSAAVINTENKSTEIALIFLGCWFTGWNETICLANATIIVHHQQEIGLAGDVARSIRGAISAISLSVYTSVLCNRLTSTVATRVPPALIEVGLPASSVVTFLQAITIGTTAAFEAVPGVSANIIASGMQAYKVANAEAYSTVYLTVIAFAGLGFNLIFFAAITESKMLGSVAATLHSKDGSDTGTGERGSEV